MEVEPKLPWGRARERPCYESTPMTNFHQPLRVAQIGQDRERPGSVQFGLAAPARGDSNDPDPVRKPRLDIFSCSWAYEREPAAASTAVRARCQGNAVGFPCLGGCDAYPSASPSR